MRADCPIETISARAYKIPTDTPEADGTLSWNATTLIVVEIAAGGQSGLGYTYADSCLVPLIDGLLSHSLTGLDPMDIPDCWQVMRRAVRNLGQAGLSATAISALDIGLWDLKAKLLDIPVCTLLGRQREFVEIYGSGGFTSYDDHALVAQLAGWVEKDGCRAVKMKIGSDPQRDPSRVAAARRAIGDAGLFVDANGAYEVAQAISLGTRFAQEQGVVWFEEPVSSDDLEGLRFVRERVPAPMEIAAGEYAYESDSVRRMLASNAVHVQQADASRIGGITGFLIAAALCEAHHVDLSGHCAPALHLHAACAVSRFRNLEWFHDHVRIEQMLFDGAPVAHAGAIKPDLSRPGLGLAFKHQDAARFAVQ